MRARIIGAAMAASLALITPAGAQSPLDGPLAAPDDVAPATPRTAHHKPKKGHRAAKSAGTPDTAEAPRATPADSPLPSRPAPADPLSLGMKWNGASDTAAQTRFQNGPNTSSGSGAEVGMKLHF